AADEHGVEAGHAANDAYVAGIGPRAAVRATGDAIAEPFVFEPVTPQPRFDRGNDVVTDAFGLGQRQPAARQGRAGARPTLDWQHVGGEPHAVLAQRSFDGSVILKADLAQNDVLARHQDRVAAEAADDLAQRGADPRALLVGDAPARHRDAEIEFAVALLVPAEMIGNLQRRHRTSCG